MKYLGIEGDFFVSIYFAFIEKLVGLAKMKQVQEELIMGSLSVSSYFCNII